MHPYRESCIIVHEPPGKKRSWFKTAYWKVCIKVRGNFLYRFDRCQHCRKAIERTSGDHINGEAVWHHIRCAALAEHKRRAGRKPAMLA